MCYSALAVGRLTDCQTVRLRNRDEPPEHRQHDRRYNVVDEGEECRSQEQQDQEADYRVPVHALILIRPQSRGRDPLVIVGSG